ncbi:MAG: patatin-like phospholipase family protein [Desulfotomaculaceae bacterium]
MVNGPAVGLALGGGFLRGVAHIGVLKAFQKSGIPVHMVAGTSAGSIVAALYAAGYTPSKMEEITFALNPWDVFDYGPAAVNLLLMSVDCLCQLLRIPFPGRRPLGLMNGCKLKALMNRLLGKQRMFGETKIPLGITAVDARDGTLVIFREEAFEVRTIIPPKDVFVQEMPVATAVRASTAVPGLFEPVRMGERLLVDGGIRENIPAYVLRQMGADLIVAVDVGYSGHLPHPVGSIVDILTQSLEIVSSESINLKLEQYADVVIRPVIKNMGPWDFDRIDYCIHQGETAAEAMVDEIKRRLESWSKDKSII